MIKKACQVSVDKNNKGFLDNWLAIWLKKKKKTKLYLLAPIYLKLIFEVKYEHRKSTRGRP